MVKDAAPKRIKTQEDDVQRRIEQLLSKEQVKLIACFTWHTLKT